MKKIMLFVILIFFGVLFIVTIIHMDMKTDMKFIAEMNSKDNFSGEEVDRFWNWKTKGNPSKEFLKIYDQKIKPLPGWHYGE